MKIHTHNPNGPLSKNQKLVIAAYQKSLTNIKVTKDFNEQGNGWILECDQIKWIRIYGTLAEAVKKVNSWKWEDRTLIY
jgi:hypothetical protein